MNIIEALNSNSQRKAFFASKGKGDRASKTGAKISSRIHVSTALTRTPLAVQKSLSTRGSELRNLVAKALKKSRKNKTGFTKSSGILQTKAKDKKVIASNVSIQGVKTRTLVRIADKGVR